MLDKSKIQTKKHVVFCVVFLMLHLVSFSQKPTTEKPVTVYVFLSETCPICQSYTLTLKNLYKEYSNKNVRFVGVFPNYYSTQKSIDEFRKTYSIPFELVLDKKWTLIERFSASITPEAFIETPDKKIVYAGRIDDSFYSLGKRRTVITSTELADALKEITSGKTVTTKKTQAVGCIISRSK